MKTPREILLQQHEAAMADLDAVRRNALNALPQTTTRSWREIIHGLRWHLAGLSAIWMAILVLQAGGPSDFRPALAGSKIPSARVLVAALLQDREDLLDADEIPAPPPQTALPLKHSEIHLVTEIV